MTLEEELFCNELGKYIYTYSKEIRDHAAFNIENTAIIILKEIRSVVENAEIDDFEAMERIVAIFYKYGLHDGGRHDF